jgi:signal transduction histidine kinase
MLGMTVITASLPDRSSLPRLLRQVGSDLLYLLTGFPIALVSFVVLVTGLALAAGLVVTLVGLPVAVFILAIAQQFAVLERYRLRLVSRTPLRGVTYRARGEGLSGLLATLRGGQRWLDALHGILMLPVATVTWSLTVAWTAATLASITWPLWFWALPRGTPDLDYTLPELIGIESTIGQIAFHALTGLLLLVASPYVLRGLAVAQASLGHVLLFGGRVGQLQERVDTLAASRAAVVDAEAQGLRRLERDLHDGPQQRLVRLTMDLGAAERRIASDDPSEAAPLVTDALAQAKDALDELRALSRGIAPPILADRGLAAALTAAAARCPVPVELDVDMPGYAWPTASLHEAGDVRLAQVVETTAYFVVTEALTNIAKHSGASAGTVAVSVANGVLRVQVTDDGHGGAHPAKGHGLAGLSDRLAALDGRLTVVSPPGGPTTVTAELPCG